MSLASMVMSVSMRTLNRGASLTRSLRIDPIAYRNGMYVIGDGDSVSVAMKL